MYQQNNHTEQQLQKQQQQQSYKKQNATENGSNRNIVNIINININIVVFLTTKMLKWLYFTFDGLFKQSPCVSSSVRPSVCQSVFVTIFSRDCFFGGHNEKKVSSSSFSVYHLPVCNPFAIKSIILIFSFYSKFICFLFFGSFCWEKDFSRIKLLLLVII